MTARRNAALLIVISGCLIAMLSFGPRASLGLFLAPMTEARGWSREIFAFSLALQNLLWGLGQPFAGMLADRYGTAVTLTLGGVLYAIGLVGMAYAESALLLHVTAGVFIGLGLAACSFSIVLAAFGKLLPVERRSWAFGIGTAAGSLGQFVFAPAAQAFISAYGWEQALILLGLFLLVVPFLALALRTPAGGGPVIGEAEIGFRDQMGEAFRHASYLWLISGFFVCGFQVAFITVHLPAYLADMGLASVAGWAIAIIGLCNVIGSYTAGMVGQKYSQRLSLSLIYLARAVAIALFITVPASPLSVYLFSAVIGFLWLSTVPLTSGLVALMFGTRYMATLFGFVFFSHQVGSFLGIWLGGRLYDTTGSYDIVWWLGVALGIFAAIVHLPIREQPVARLASGQQ